MVRSISDTSGKAKQKEEVCLSFPMALSIKAIFPIIRRIATKDTTSLPNANTLEDSRITLFQA